MVKGENNCTICYEKENYGIWGGGKLTSTTVL